MKKHVLFLLLVLSSFVLQAQTQVYTPDGVARRFTNRLGIPIKDTATCTWNSDSAHIHFGTDGLLYAARFKGVHRPVAFADGYVTIAGLDTITGRKVLTDTVFTTKEFRITNGIGNVNLGEEVLEASSTGLKTGGALSIGSPTSTYSVGSGTGHVINKTTERYKAVSWAASNNRTPSLSDALVHILIDSNGAIVEQNTFPTREQRRSLIYLGYIAQQSGTVLATTASSQVIAQPINQVYDFWDAYGAFNVSGNVLTAAGANLQVNKTAGTIFKGGSNFQVNPNDPNVRSQSAATPLVFQYATQLAGSSSGVNTSNIDPTQYDNGGVVTPIAGSGNQATIQPIFLYPTGTVRIQYGQTVYSSLSQALAAIATSTYVQNPSFTGNAILLGYVVVTKGATALNDPTNARVLMNVTSTQSAAVTGTPFWGDIQGSLNNQTDLRDTLAARVRVVDTAAMLAPFIQYSDTSFILSQVVRTFGAQSIAGSKTFTTGLNVNDGVSNVITLNTSGNVNAVRGTFETSTGSVGAVTGTSNSSTGFGISAVNNANGVAFVASTENSNAGRFFNNGLSPTLIIRNNGGGSLIRAIRNTTDTVFYVDNSGATTAQSFIKTGGTSSQFLKADGSVDGSTYLTTSTAASTYVPYTGATTNVNLGSNTLTAGGATLTGALSGTSGTFVGGNAGNLILDNTGQQFTQLLFQRNQTANTGFDLLVDGTNSTVSMRTLAVMPIVFSTSALSGTPVERMRITTGGNVGIGTTSPVVASGAYTGLDIRGSGGSSITLGSTSTLYSYLYAESSGLYIQSVNSVPIIFLPNGTERGQITSAGRWLFGTTTDDGSSIGQFNGNVAVSGDVNVVGSVSATASSNSTTNTVSTLNGNTGGAAVNRLRLGNSNSLNAFTIDVFGGGHASSPNAVAIYNNTNADLLLGGYGLTALTLGFGRSASFANTLEVTDTTTIRGKLYVRDVSTGSSGDSILVKANDGEVKKVAQNTLASSGTYTPTITGVANVSSSTASVCQYIRIGNVVTVYGKASISTTTTGNTTFDISLPISSALSLDSDANGVCTIEVAEANMTLAPKINANTLEDRMRVIFELSSSGTYTLSFTFSYEIK